MLVPVEDPKGVFLKVRTGSWESDTGAMTGR